MKTNEYKNEVGSLKLTQEFKQELKLKMLQAAEGRTAEKPQIKMSAVDFSKKYSKYAALAACLLMAVSTVGVLSATKNVFKFGNNNANCDEADEELLNEAYHLDSETYFDDADIDDAIGIDNVAEDDVAEDAYDDLDVTDAEDTSAEEPAVLTESGDRFEDVDEPISDRTPAVAIPVTGNGYSPDASAKYDGHYYGIDYVVNDTVGSGEYEAVVVEEINLHLDELKSSVPSYTTVTEATPVEESGSDNNEVSNDSSPEADIAVEEEIPATVQADIPTPDSEPVHSFDPTPRDELKSFEELTSGDSKEYYDIRDRVLAKLDNIALIRFTIVDSYETKQEVTANADKVTMDISSQTLYRINITYDYFNQEDADVDRLMLNTGRSDYQLIGRPAMEGEYIAVVTQNKDGILEPIPQLIYAVHKVRGLDIAYHLYSDDGFMVDPGNTNMGLMPEEQMVTNSTVNNPEVYTQKAEVRELTYYLRRNILRLDPNLLEFKEHNSAANSEEENDSQEQEQEAPVELRKTIRANFPAGKLKLSSGGEALEIGSYSSDTLDSLEINDIGVGADMQTALKAFLLSSYAFTPDAKITLAASAEEGGWFAVVTFSENVIEKIEVFN